MNTTWCLRAHKQGLVIIDKVFLVNRDLIYKNIMARVCHTRPVSQLWHMHIAGKNYFTCRDDAGVGPIQQADRNCFAYIEENFNHEIGTALVHSAEKEAHLRLLNAVQSPFFGTLPLLIRPR